MRFHWQCIPLFMVLYALWAVAQQDTQLLPTTLPGGSASVSDFKGDVSIRSPKGDVLPAERGLQLESESVIETRKGSLLLNLEDGSQVLVKSNSRVILKSPELSAGLYLELLLGRLVAKIQKRLGEVQPFRMGTPSAVITVRGTRFEVEVTKQKRTYVEVLEGIVEVQGLGTGGRSILIHPGFSSGISPGRDPSPPRNRAEEMREFNERFNNRQDHQGERSQPGDEGSQQNQPSERENDRPD